MWRDLVPYIILHLDLKIIDETKIILMASGPELLKVSQSHTTALNSSTEKGLIKLPSSIQDNRENCKCQILGRAALCARKWFTKWEQTTYSTGFTPSTKTPSTTIEHSELRRLRLAKAEWKYFELASPSRSQFNLDCCQQILVLRREKEWMSDIIPCSSPYSSSDNSSSRLQSRAACLTLSEEIFVGKLCVCDTCHSFSADLINFNFSFRTKPSQPVIWKEFHLSRTNYL